VATIERDDIEQALAQKGFQLEEGDHRFYRLYVAGKKTSICTKVSRGRNYKTLGEDLVSLMAQQMKLTAKQLREFVDCSLSHEGYVGALRARGERV